MRSYFRRRRRDFSRLSLELLEPRRVLDSTVVFNEIMYHPADDAPALEWIELHNQMSVDINLSDWSLQNAVEFRFPAGTVLGGGKYLLVATAPDVLRAAIGAQDTLILGPYRGQLANGGERLELRSATDRLMDVLEYDDQADWPAAADGSGASLAKIEPQSATEPAGNWTFSRQIGGTPGAVNFPASGHWLPLDAPWRYQQSGQPPADDWRLVDFNDNDWSLGRGLFYAESSALPGPKNTPLTLGRRTYHFRTTFDLPPNAQQANLRLGHVIDDGAVFYLNGHEIARPGMPDGPITYETLARDSINNATYRSLTLPAEWLRDGQNTLAVEVHQVLDSSNDVVFGAEVLGEVPGSADDVAQRVELHEVAATRPGFWVELHNRSDRAMSLQGFLLASSDPAAPFCTLPALELPARGFLVVDAAQLGFAPQAGQTLSLYGPGRTTVIDAVRLHDQVQGRSPEHEGRWQTARVATPGAANDFGFEGRIVINEIMYHARPQYASGGEPSEQGDGLPRVEYAESDEEWIELYNRGRETIDLSGWQLADAVSYRFDAGVTLAAGEYLVIARDAAALLRQHPGIRIAGGLSGRLSDQGERIQLLDARGNLADEVHYYDAGRWPEAADGGGSSLELRDPRADNSRGEAWAASDESSRTQWQHVSYTRTVERIVLDPPIRFHEFVMGLLSAGEVLLDNLSVVEDPGGVGARELIQNGTFEQDVVGTPAAKWRLVGTHRQSEVVADPDQPDNHVLRLIAESRMSYLSNHAETTLANGARVVNGRKYQISYDARWVTGSPQLHTELYYKDAARTTVLVQPSISGTPGQRNSTWQENVGPTFDALHHDPPVPTDSDPVTVSVVTADPDGMASVRLHYAIDGQAPFTPITMVAGPNGHYSATIPAQPHRSVVQFYVQAEDRSGATSMFPAAGPDSRALYKVDNAFSLDPLRHDFRIVMTSADSRELYAATNMVDNNRWGSTVIYDGQEIFYDVGTRLKGSMFSRQNVSNTGYNVRFHPDQLFRGVHDTLRFDQNGEAEILVKYFTAMVGNLGGSYDDVLRLTTPTGQGGGPTLTYLAAHDDLFLREQFEDGEEGTVFKFEGIRVMTSTVDGKPESLKIYQPIDWMPQFDIQDLGDDKELYRWPYLIARDRDRDDYRRIIDLAQAFSKSGTALESAVQQVIDVDQWMSTFAIMSLWGIGDAYSQGNPHNLNLYVRPSDDLVLAFPWDWDFVFNQVPTAPLHGNQNIGKVIEIPSFKHLFLGHLQHMIQTQFNRTALDTWVRHFGTMLGESYTSYLTNIEQRGRNVLDQLPARVPFAVAGSNVQTISTRLVSEQLPAQALIPTVENGGDRLGTSWTQTGFVPSDRWVSGQTGVGFETAPGLFADLIQLNVQPMYNTSPSVFVRIPFDVSADLSQIERLTLRMKYDDGFVAYLNGVAIAQANAPASAEWNSMATASHQNSAAISFVDFDVTPYLGLLRPGQNVLAIQGLNRLASSNDLLILPELVAESPSQPGEPNVISVETPSIALSGRGWVNVRQIRLAGQPQPLDVRWTDTTTWQATIPLQPGRNDLHLEAIDFAGQVVGQDHLIVQSTATRPLIDLLRISEFMYHPPDPTLGEIASGFAGEDDFEFVELLNISRDWTLDLTGVQLQGAVQAVLPEVRLAPGQRTVIASNPAALRQRYGDQVPIAAQYSGVLSNASDRFELLDPAGATIVQVSYRDEDPWPLRADGNGSSLEMVDPAAMPLAQSSEFARWRASTDYGGSPGATGAPAPGIVINEVLANPAAASGLTDSIELFNPTDRTIDLSGWYLSDSVDNLLKYAIPAGTSLEAGQYLLLDERDFNPTPAHPQPHHFALSGNRGDDVWLVVPNGQGAVAEFVDDVHFGASRNGETFGRWPNGQGRLAPMPQPTLGSGNNPPRVGPVVIDEIQFDSGVPAAAALAIAPALTADDLEFIELHNPAAEPCDLTGWQIAGGIQFEFPDGTLLPPGGTLLVVSFDPATPANASRLAAFRVHYGLPAGTHVVGGYDQHLSADGELLRLLRAPTSTQNLDLNRLLLEDESLYQRQPPWPDVPADSGQSLQRQVPRGWGNLASSWCAATPTPGQTAAVRGDFNRDGVLDVRDVDLLSEGIRRGDLTFDLDADGAAGPHDLTYLVETLLGRRRGDANLDGIFDSADIIRAFTAGEYEDSIAGNSTWSEGDWNGDGEFNSADFVAAFAAGSYAAASKPKNGVGMNWRLHN